MGILAKPKGGKVMSHKKALEGLRVLDFTWSVAGPTITRILAGLGAEVIKVEWPAYPDPMRTSMYKRGEKRMGLDNGGFYNWMNIGKRSFTIDARSSEGLEIVKKLIKKSDLISESFSASVFENWGLSYEEIKKINPKIIYVSVSGFGHSGRNSHMTTWGPVAQGFSGLTSMSGLPNKEPAGWGWSYMDHMAGHQAATAVLMAIYNTKITGEGQYIDVSQTDISIPLLGASILDYTVNGKRTDNSHFPIGSRAVYADSNKNINGYRGEIGAPYNVYPTKGNGSNDYCVISVLSEVDWENFKEALGNPEWLEQAQFKTVKERIKNQDELDDYISQWTKQRGKYEIMHHLQDFGIACGAVQSSEDRMENDPQLEHRDNFPVYKHPLLGSHRFERLPFRMSITDPEYEGRWPIYGEDNEYVLGEILGFTEEQIIELENKGITWPKDMLKDATVEFSKW